MFISFSLVIQFLLKFLFLFYQILGHLCRRGRSRRLAVLLIYCATRAVRVVRIARAAARATVCATVGTIIHAVIRSIV